MNYTNAYISIDRVTLLNELQRRVSKKRYRHILGVEQTILELAQHYGEIDLEQASVAALLHDFAKEYDVSQMYRLALTVNPELNRDEGNGTIWHGMAAAGYAMTHYQLQDTSIIHALCEHTIGNRTMDLLSKLLYIADYIEPGRDFDGLSKARKLAYTDLDAAVFYKMHRTIQHLVSTKKPLYIESVINYNAWVKRMHSSEQSTN